MGGHYQMDNLDSNVFHHTTNYKNAKQNEFEEKKKRKSKLFEI